MDHEIEPWLNCELLANFQQTDGIFQVESGVPYPRGSRKPKEKAEAPKPPTKRRKEDPPEQGQLF